MNVCPRRGLYQLHPGLVPHVHFGRSQRPMSQPESASSSMGLGAACMGVVELQVVA